MAINSKNTIRYGITAGIVWTVLAAAAAVLGRLQITFFAPGADAVGYGVVRPLYTTFLVFGAGMSLFYASSYYLTSKGEGIELKFPLLGFAAFILQQASVIIGTVTILSGANKGREFGEMSWISDKLMILSLILFLIHICYSVKDKSELKRSTVFTIISGSGAIVFYILGNFSLPYGLGLSALPFNGMQDAAAQEFYRMGVLGYFILMPVFAALYYFVPAKSGSALYSKSLADLQALTMILLIPISGAAFTFATPGPQIIAGLGMIANALLSVSILAGFMNVFLTLKNSSSSDSVVNMLKFGSLVMVIYALIRGISGYSFMQERFGLTAWNMQDISMDAAFYALPILFASAYAVLEDSGKTVSSKLIQVHTILMIAAFAVLLIGNILEGSMAFYNLKAMTAEGALKTSSWSQAAYLSTAKGAPNLAGFHTIGLIGTVILALSFLTGAAAAAPQALKK